MIAVSIRPSFCEPLREESAEWLSIRWAWFRVFAYSVETVGYQRAGQEDSERVLSEDVVESFMKAAGTVGVDTEEDIEQIRIAFEKLADLHDKKMQNDSWATVEMGKLIGRLAGVDLTNPARIVKLGLLFWHIYTEVATVFEEFRLISAA